MPSGSNTDIPLLAVSADQWQQARERLNAVERLLACPSRTRAMVDAEAKALGISHTVLYGLIRRYRKNPHIEAMLPGKPGRASGTLRLPDAVEAIITATIDKFYATKQRPKLSQLVRAIHEALDREGLSARPTRNSIQTRVARLDQHRLTRDREGAQVARQRHGAKPGRLEAAEPLAIVQVDHTLVDVIIVDDIFRRPLIRPWLTVAIDVRTRVVLGFFLTLQSPSLASVAYALAHAVLPKKAWLDTWQLPADSLVSGRMRALHFDNAKEFKAEGLIWGCRKHRIEPLYRPVRTPHFGGHVERLIGTLMGEVHLLPGTTFSSIEQRAAYDPAKTACMTLRELERWLALQIAGVYHQDRHSSLKRPPLAVWRDEIGDTARDVHTLNAGTFIRDFLPLERRTLQPTGIRLFGERYWGDVLRPWIGLRPDKLVVRFDPRDISTAWLYEDGDYWPLALQGWSDGPITYWEHKAALGQKREQGHRERNEAIIFQTVREQRALVASSAHRTAAARKHVQTTISAVEDLRRFAPAALPPVPSTPAEPDPPDRLVPLNPGDIEEWS